MTYDAARAVGLNGSEARSTNTTSDVCVVYSNAQPPASFKVRCLDFSFPVTSNPAAATVEVPTKEMAGIALSWSSMATDTTGFAKAALYLGHSLPTR